jgi:hypothetical protein
VNLYVPENSVNKYRSQEPWSKFGKIAAISEYSENTKYTLTYIVDGEVYKTYQLEAGERITPEAEPTKEDYKFSGWSEIPSMMPAHDVTVMGTFEQVVFAVDDVKVDVSSGEAFIVSGKGSIGDVEIPAKVTINGTTYNVTGIADDAFLGNISLTSITIPNSLETIGDFAFYGCTNLTMIHIGSGIKTIASKAFGQVATARTRSAGEGLKMYCDAVNVPTTAGDAFEGSDLSNAVLIVPDDSETSYKTSAPWSSFGKIMGAETYLGIDGIFADVGESWIYDLNGNRIDKPKSGVNIFKMKNGKARKIIVR